jgi:hypothetical protein
MASNKELRDEIESLANQIGIEQPDTERLGNPALVTLTQKLRDDLAKQAASGSSSSSGATGASGASGATGATGATASAAPPAPPPPPPVTGDVPANSAGQPPERLPPGTPIPYVPQVPFEVAPGKSLSTLSGILVAGQEITATDVGSVEQLEHLVGLGYVLKGPAKKG